MGLEDLLQLNLQMEHGEILNASFILEWVWIPGEIKICKTIQPSKILQEHSSTTLAGAAALTPGRLGITCNFSTGLLHGKSRAEGAIQPQCRCVLPGILAALWKAV